MPQYSGASTLKYTSFPQFMGDTFVCTSVSVGQNRVSLCGGGGGGGAGGRRYVMLKLPTRLEMEC